MEVEDDKDAKEEAAVLKDWMKLSERETELKLSLKVTKADLDENALTKYPKLTGAEVKTLVVEDKWFAALEADIHGEMDRISQALTQRVKELADRYESPMPKIVGRVAELETKVNGHLRKMGFV